MRSCRGRALAAIERLGPDLVGGFWVGIVFGMQSDLAAAAIVVKRVT